MESEILIFPFWPPNQASKSSAEMADLVRGNPWGLVIIFGKSYFLVLSKSIGNLTQKTVGYPSRKVVEHIFFRASDIWTDIDQILVGKRQIFGIQTLKSSKKICSTTFLEGYPAVF